MRKPGSSAITSQDERHAAEDLAQTLPNLILRAEQLTRNFNPGHHGRRKSGTGEDFWQFKSYSQGDAANQIDWRQSAKRDQLFVRQKELETAESVWIWCDSGATMHYRSALAPFTKLFDARVLTLATGLLLDKAGENFALLGAAERAAHGQAAFNRFAQSLMLFRPLPLRTMAQTAKLPPHTRVVLISDFLTDMEDIRHAIRHFTDLGAQGIVVHVVDPAEASLPFQGRTKFDGLCGEPAVTIGRVETVREEYRQLFDGHRSALTDTAEQVHWEYICYQTDQSGTRTLASLVQFLERGR
jgi:uncharacterized protein (DUF58 family)